MRFLYVISAILMGSGSNTLILLSPVVQECKWNSFKGTDTCTK